MVLNHDNYAKWDGKSLSVQILYSKAGVAQHIWIENNHSAFLVDCGDGILRDIIKRKLNLEKLESIFITHGHFDHVGGLHSLLGFLRMIGRENRLAIYAPEHCSEASSLVSEFRRIYDLTTEFPIINGNIGDNEAIIISDVEIKAFPVTHYGSVAGAGITDKLPALGYRFTFDDESIAITGDCGTNKFDKNLVKNADLAIIESTFKNDKSITKETIKKVHLTEKIAKEYGKLAKEYILVHKAYK